ncbi:glycosyltransferase family 9 protein [bacterium]
MTNKYKNQLRLKKRLLNLDCRYFEGDRPCTYHKEEQVVCNNCKYYSPVKERILIIKLDAMGDVLRTTFILSILKKKYPNAHITWIVSAKSYGVLDGNKLIDKLMLFDDAKFSMLSRKFDISINLDLEDKSLDMATIVNAKEKFGFIKSKNGIIKPLNETAKYWLFTSAFDDLKKQNDLTYQYLAALSCGFKFKDESVIVLLDKAERKYADSFFKKHKLTKKPIVGLNIGSGARWVSKRWPIKHWENLIKLLKKDGYAVVIFGGPEESTTEKLLIKKTGVKSAGTNNSVPRFFALLNKVDVLVTGDTLGLHAAIGLGKKIVAFFGSTSSTEICMYSLGKKLVTKRNCICCYKISCEKNCLEKISPEMAYKAVKEVVGK